MFKNIGEEAEVAVFSNGFALDRMIQGCAMAADPTKLLQALTRLNGFVKHNHADLTGAQRTSIEGMAAKQRGRGAAVWTEEVGAAYEQLTGGVASEHAAASTRRESRAEEYRGAAGGGAGADAGSAGGGGGSGAGGAGGAAVACSAGGMTPYLECPAGRKLFCRIDRETTVRHRTYRLFLQAMYPDVDDEQAVEQSEELYMLSSRKVKASMKANYHIYETKDCSGEYVGKIRNTEKKKFVVYDSDSVRQAAKKAREGGGKADLREADGSRKQQAGMFFDEEDNLNMVHLLTWKQGVQPEEGASLHELWQSGRRADILHLCNKKPTWNDDVGMWSLAFEGTGRVVLASAKNFVLHCPEEDKVYMQFGKQDANSFTLDFRAPITPFIAFTFAMSFFEL